MIKFGRKQGIVGLAVLILVALTAVYFVYNGAFPFLQSTQAATTAIIKTPKNGDSFDFNKNIEFLGEEGCTTCSYWWTFGDGSSAKGLSATHSYSKPGIYKVRFMVKEGFRAKTSEISLNIGGAKTSQETGTGFSISLSMWTDWLVVGLAILVLLIALVLMGKKKRG